LELLLRYAMRDTVSWLSGMASNSLSSVSPLGPCVHAINPYSDPSAGGGGPSERVADSEFPNWLFTVDPASVPVLLGCTVTTIDYTN
jgi:hypothetical protein